MPEKVLSPDEPSSLLRRIPIHDNGEPLVDFVELCPEIIWVDRHPVFEYHRFRLARRSLAEKLAAAATSLLEGIRLVIVECWRAPAIQQQMHAETRKRLRGEHPEWSETYL